MNLKKILLGTALISMVAAANGQPKEQFVPANFYWAGSYAAGGSGISGGFLDYLEMLNERDGGMNGVTFTWATFDFSADPTSEDEINTPACRPAARALSVS